MVGYLEFDVLKESRDVRTPHFFTTMNIAPVASQIVHSNREPRRENQNSHYALPAYVSEGAVQREALDHDLQSKPKHLPEMDVVPLHTRTSASEKKDKNGGRKSVFIYAHAGQSIRLNLFGRPSTTFQV